MSAEGYVSTLDQDTRYGSSIKRAATLAAVLLVATACSSPKPNNNDGTPVATTPPVTTSPTAAPTPSKACILPGAGFETAIRTNGDVVTLSRYLVGGKIDMAPHTTNGECYEQVTFRFGGKRVSGDPLPGVHARYVAKPLLKPSDKPVAVPGSAFLEIDIGNWWYKSGGGEGPKTITDPTMHNVQAVQQTQNIEGVSTWVVGLAARQPFSMLPVTGTAECPELCFALKIQAD